MSAITINDLPTNRALDRKAMSSIRGADGAPSVYGWINAYSPATTSLVPVVNFYQANNSFYIEKMINQSQTVNINNSGANSAINAVLLSSLSSS
ncbi:hypothetical protein ACFQAT_05535 [Undibacterium arcticum]|uniref:Uncharacterized protein n=1 Tax=Undibacterium arcticum TaxID=1762892 RepID=A0ABV7EY28_9BURK